MTISEELKQELESIKGELKAFLKDWKDIEDEDLKNYEKNNPLYTKTQSIIKLIEEVLKSDKLNEYQDFLKRIEKLITNKEYLKEERQRITEQIEKWELAKNKLEMGQRGELTEKIDEIRDQIRTHLTQWHERLTEKKDYGVLIKQEREAIKEWLKAFSEESQADIQLINQATIIIKLDFEEIGPYEQIFSDLESRGIEISKFQQHLNNWRQFIQNQKEKPADNDPTKALYIKLIETSLKNNSLRSYKDLVAKIKAIKYEPELKLFEYCPEGLTCLEHFTGNWLGNWEKLQKDLKELEATLKQEQKEAKKAPCDCLHCSHGLGAWTWKLCKYYETSINKQKERLPNIGGTEGDKWKPPTGWNPYPISRPKQFYHFQIGGNKTLGEGKEGTTWAAFNSFHWQFKELDRIEVIRIKDKNQANNGDWASTRDLINEKYKNNGWVRLIIKDPNLTNLTAEEEKDKRQALNIEGPFILQG